ncbi:MAG: Protein PsiE [Candidatus Celerinatantimonas neptuna]|nr:MAG: Protein PsiE [Candidatus Celerinatantimonas neptuna]
MDIVKKLHSVIEKIGLMIILGVTVLAAVTQLYEMWVKQSISVSDILLLFMFLEFISMTQTYWKMGQLPVRMPLYIAMIAIARHIMVEPEHINALNVAEYALAIVFLGVAVLVVRYGHVKFPYKNTRSEPDEE